jgi:hypothetical protein
MRSRLVSFLALGAVTAGLALGTATMANATTHAGGGGGTPPNQQPPVAAPCTDTGLLGLGILGKPSQGLIPIFACQGTLAPLGRPGGLLGSPGSVAGPHGLLGGTNILG